MERESSQDIVTVYAARWCLHSLRFEQLLLQMLARGHLDDLRDDVKFVLVRPNLYPARCLACWLAQMRLDAGNSMGLAAAGSVVDGVSPFEQL